MDCNSIIYDAVNKMEYKEEKTQYEIENDIIDSVIKNIKKYIEYICPTNTVFIAFDGVAPFAKMEQQRTRRYKSEYMTKLHQNKGESNTKWNTSAITPGTKFMETLSKRIEIEFINNETKYNVQKMIVSPSTMVGEGEHKIMDYIRTGNNRNETIALYGLDADLIMLSIFQLRYCKNIFVFREAPEFIKSSIPVNIQDSKNDIYFLDIDNLSTSIVKEMGYQDKHRTYDYVFLCFLLGNDFLPHFPAMNIRTHGIQALMDIYRLTIGNKEEKYFISKTNFKIQWKNVGIFMNEIAKREHEFLMNEYFVREKFSKRTWNETTEEEKEEILLNTPIIYNAEEKYICPSEKGWQKRYYNTLFHENNINIKTLCLNYIEGLEWVYKYYTSSCPHWKWKYNYHYPPLFSDLVKYIPHFETDFIESLKTKPFSPELQLSYVLPPSQLKLLPTKIHHFLINHYHEYYPETYDFQWSFCRYFWESHPLLPEIPIELLEQWDIQFQLSKAIN